jgi:hypothetical protein
VSSAVTIEPLPEFAIQVALTADGMRALGIDDAVVDGFAAEFVVGMGNDANRARRLGDVGANDPSRWQWGSGDRVPHVAVLLYAMPGRLAVLQQAIESQCQAGFERMACLATSDLDGIEPFGFTDGISQPLLDWERKRAARDAERTSTRTCAVSVKSCSAIRTNTAATPTGRCSIAPLRADAAERRGRARPRRPRQERQLSGAAPAAPGRARLLADSSTDRRAATPFGASSSRARWSVASATALR